MSKRQPGSENNRRISGPVKKAILKQLREIEEQHEVKIFYACESGSRAWGFASADSDYDVRFLYTHPREWYLSVDLERKRDVIEQPIDGELDISGWDLRKALQLLRKSNPPLLEWLRSPIVYRQQPAAIERFRELIPVCYSPKACYHHYLHMAQGNFREYLKGEEVWLKKYFYVLRPLLALRWIEYETGTVPMEFEIMVHRLITDGKLKEEIQNLLTLKRDGNELQHGPRIEPISRFIEQELQRFEQMKVKRKPYAGTELLNAAFREMLSIIWQD